MLLTLFKKSNDFRHNFRILLAVGLVVLLGLGMVMLASGFVSTERFRVQIQQAVKDAIGKDMAIKGQMSVSLLPAPTIYIPGIEIRDTSGDTRPPAISAAMLKVGVSFASVFSDQPQITRITLEQPVLEITRKAEGVIDWGWLTQPFLREVIAGKNSTVRNVQVSGGKLLLIDKVTDRSTALDNIHLGASRGGQLEFAGSATLTGRPLRFRFYREATPDIATVAEKDKALPVGIQLSMGDKNRLEWKGSLNLAGEYPVSRGQVTLAVEDLLSWFPVKSELRFDVFGRPVKEDPSAASKLPLDFSARWLQDGLTIGLSEIQAKGIGSDGGGKLAVAWGDIPAVDVNMDFATLDYDQWWLLVTRIREFLAAGENTAARGDNPLPASVRIRGNITAKELRVGGTVRQDVVLSAKLEDQVITVDRFSAAFAGQTALTLFGVISPGATKALRFEGVMEAKGESLRDFLAAIDPAAAGLPEQDFGRYYVHSNLFVSPEQIRLSDADLNISDFQLSGGVVMYNDANPRTEADIRLKAVNFDYFRDIARNRQTQTGTQSLLATLTQGQSFGWLKGLSRAIDLKINVEQFTFLDRKGDKASMRIYARAGELGIHNIRFAYPNDTLEGSFAVDAKAERPFFTLTLNTAQLNTDYFRTQPEGLPSAEAKGNTRWPETLIDLSWLRGLGASLEVGVKAFTHRGVMLPDVKLKAKIDNEQITLQECSFGCWQGSCNVRGSIYGGAVPGMGISFTTYNTELKDMMQTLAERSNVSGKMSVSGTLAASGVNVLSWVSQLEGNMTLAGRGVNVQGLSLQGVINAVGNSRTAADVLTNVNLAIANGNTVMNADGVVNINKGVVRTPGITLKASTITGNLTGGVNLVPWTMELSTLFQFPMMRTETIPTLAVQLAGSVDAPKLQTDTASLEAYVAKRIVGR